MREGHATIQSRNGSTVPLTLFGLTKTFTCVQLSNTYLSATLTTATFPTAAACRGFDASACTPTPRDLLSSHWQLRLHLIWKVANPLYRCAPRGTRTDPCPLTLLNHCKHSISDDSCFLYFPQIHLCEDLQECDTKCDDLYLS